MPYQCNDPRVIGWAMETLDELWSESATSESTVELVHAVMLKREHKGPSVQDFISKDYKEGQGGDSPLPAWTTDRRLDFQHLTVEMLSWQNQIYKLRIPSEKELVNLGYLHAWLFRTPIVDSPRQLERMLEQVEKHDNTISVDFGHEFGSLRDIVKDAAELSCDGVVNCAGLASSTLCEDSKVIGGRGIILNYDREASKRKEFIHDASGEVMVNDAVIMTDEAPWGTETEACYLIPRGNVLVVGGSYLEGDTATEIRPAERKRLLKNAQCLGIDTENSEPTAEWVGFRPARETVRCEVDETAGKEEGVRVVHNYGHGGSGWTINVGTAKEVARLLGHN
jgi:D-amino-acid oxidase